MKIFFFWAFSRMCSQTVVLNSLESRCGVLYLVDHTKWMFTFVKGILRGFWLRANGI